MVGQKRAPNGGRLVLPSRLREILENLSTLAIAYSGGIDSRFLCHAALLCGCQILALHARGPHVPATESEFAHSWARSVQLPVRIVEFNPLNVPLAVQNTHERCYYCKKALLTQLAQYGQPLCDGTNADDLKANRPGLRALAEAGIISPLAEAGLGKNAVRHLAALTGLAYPEQKARPCLLTRFAYDLRPDIEKLRRLELAEGELFEILGKDTDFRIRLAPEPVLQVESWRENSRRAVEQTMRKYGFDSFTVKISRDISGYFDRND